MALHDGSVRAKAVEVLLRRSRFGSLPRELLGLIFECLGLGPVIAGQPTGVQTQPVNAILPVWAHPALQPPQSGACWFMALPAELRRNIFAYELAGRDVVYSPRCSAEDHSNRQPARDSTPPPAKRNRSSDLMTINKVICDEISTVLYEERYFIIHIHEGLRHGGIEFLDAGRQKLQYREDVLEDNRFARFKLGEDFGFHRLKKIKIVIFPPGDDEPESRHMQINTFFMTWALCQLLQRSEEENKLKYITVEFSPPQSSSEGLSGRRAIAKAENYLWDALIKKPTAKSIQWLPDIEVLLRPFAILRAHNVQIGLPEKLREHEPTQDFITRLERRMLSAHGNQDEYDTDLMDEKYAHTIRGLSGDFMRYMFDTLHGAVKGSIVDNLGEYELWEEDEEDDTKRGLSPETAKRAGDLKRQKGGRKKSRDPTLDALMAEEEEEELQRAIASSLKDTRATHGMKSKSDTGSSSPFSTPGRTLGSATPAYSAPSSLIASQLDDSVLSRTRQPRRQSSLFLSDASDDPFGDSSLVSRAPSELSAPRISFNLRGLGGGPSSTSSTLTTASGVYRPNSFTPVPTPAVIAAQADGAADKADKANETANFKAHREKLKKWHSLADS